MKLYQKLKNTEHSYKSLSTYSNFRSVHNTVSPWPWRGRSCGTQRICICNILCASLQLYYRARRSESSDAPGAIIKCIFAHLVCIMKMWAILWRVSRSWLFACELASGDFEWHWVALGVFSSVYEALMILCILREILINNMWLIAYTFSLHIFSSFNANLTIAEWNNRMRLFMRAIIVE